jgi:DNA-binding NtrC family response regulator
MKRALVVDDDRMMARTLCDVLRAHGWEVTGVNSGEAAVDAVAGERFDVVLMDVRMEGMTGVDALRAMRRLRPTLKVILMTAYTAADLLAEAEREGALRILSKPLAIPALMQMLQHDGALGGRRVLVVDDNRDYLATLCAVIERAGHTVSDARTLDEAVANLEADHPSVVVLDHRLDNVELPDSIIAIKRVSPAVAVILYSGHVNVREAASQVPPAWIHSCLQKPFPPERLVELLDDLLA